MEKKEGTHLVLSGKVCGREEKIDGKCGNFLKGLYCSFSGLLCCTGCMVQITCTDVPVVWCRSHVLM